MLLYDTKCVIKTDITLGSVFTSNATDGMKTIFYIDCSGFQFKRSGALVGYLQFETSSMQMNNQNSNFFSENTFTFEDGKNQITNSLIEKVYQYICDKAEEYKYHLSSSTDSLELLVKALKEAKIPVNPGLIKRKLDEKSSNQQKRYEQAIQEIQQQENEIEIQRKFDHTVNEIHQKMKTDGNEAALEFFLDALGNLSTIQEITELWKMCQLNVGDFTAQIEQIIETAYTIERMQGPVEDSTKELIETIRDLSGT